MKNNLFFQFCKHFFLILLSYSLIRLHFFISNANQFENENTTTIINSFLTGIRFDVSTLLFLFIPFVIYLLLQICNLIKPLKNKHLKASFLLIHLPFILLNLVDNEYFKFTGKRTQSSIFYILEDVKNQFFQLIINFWYIALLFILASVLLFFLYGNNEHEKLNFSLKQKISSSILLIALFVIGFRGGVQLKPLAPNNAFENQSHTLGTMSLNSPYIFLYSLADGKKELKRLHYFATDLEAKKLITATYHPVNQPNTNNVVILILESFDSEYLGIGNDYKGYTPFFDSLAKAGTYFPKSYANGRTSIEALPSILASIPSLMDAPYTSSPYQSNKITGLGSLLKQKGYNSSFFHGGKNGTMGFNTFSKMAGFDDYYGLNEYPNKSDFDGNWGVFDEPFLQFYAQKLASFKEPFASAIFTLSSHQPYAIPEKHKGKFPKGTLEIHESIGYADYSLKKFFETAQQMPWFKNTLFVLTADHTQMSDQNKYSYLDAYFTVPIVFYHPSKKIEVNTKLIAQHVDIAPTILAYLGFEKNELPVFGKSLFEKNTFSHTLNYNNDIDRLLFEQYALEYRPLEDKIQYFDLMKYKKIQVKETSEKELLLLKAYRQYFNNCLIDNEWK
jgi:phosphoglycerol transferase MdoB-like AlkP superfamily enzyme